MIICAFVVKFKGYGAVLFAGPGFLFSIIVPLVAPLDVSIQAQVPDLLADIRDETAVSYILISHDLAVVSMPGLPLFLRSRRIRRPTVRLPR